MTEQQHEKAVDRIHTKYKARMLAFLKRIGKACKKLGIKADAPFEMADDEYAYWMTVRYPGADQDDSLDMQLYLVDSLAREGSLDGVSFSLMSAMYSGVIDGPSLSPSNYTEGLWIPVTDAEAIKERWQIFEDADPEEAAQLAKEALDKHTSRGGGKRRHGRPGVGASVAALRRLMRK